MMLAPARRRMAIKDDDDGDDGFCQELLTTYPVNLIGSYSVGVVMVILGFTYLISSLTIVYFIKRQMHLSVRGDVQATKSIIFEAYLKVLYANAAVNLYVFFIAITFTFQPYQNGADVDAWAFSTMWTLQHIIIEGVAFLLMEKGIGKRANKRTAQKLIIWATITFFICITVYKAGRTLSFFFAKWHGKRQC